MEKLKVWHLKILAIIPLSEILEFLYKTYGIKVMTEEADEFYRHIKIKTKIKELETKR